VLAVVVRTARNLAADEMMLDATGLRIERGGVAVVDHLDLAIERGRWCGVIGANGSGKTSLLRAMAGRLPIAAGTMTIGGDEVAMDRAARARCVGFAPPIETLPDALKASDVLRLVGGSVDMALVRAGRLREALQIDTLLARRIGNFSAGMKQRLAIACAFAGGHQVVVLDEPFNWLDPVAAFDVRVAIRVLVDDGKIVITALHDLTTLVAACDQGVLMRAGKVAVAIDRAQLGMARADPLSFERDMIAVLRAQS
jgi:ABC-2 type transport system ATP-binding protein